MPSSNQPIPVSSFTGSLGINTHVDFNWTAYGNFANVEKDLGYLGLHNVRDGAGSTPALLTQLHNDLGVQFDLFTDPNNWSAQLQSLKANLPAGSVRFIEGANEPDMYGPSVASAQQAQTQIYSAAHSLLGVPVIQMSWGSVYDYGITGDQSAYADYGNAHTYFGSGNNPALNGWIDTLNAYAEKSTPGKPVIDTETGYYTTGNPTDPHTVDETVQAKYTLDDLLDSYKSGDAVTYLYELLDDYTGDGNDQHNFGLFHSDGSPKLAATGVHNMVALLNDTGGAVTPTPLAYDLGGMQATDNSMLMEKSDGTYWLALWNDTRLSGPNSPTEIAVPPHTVTLNLGATANSIQVFDPLQGTTAVQNFGAVGSAGISVPDHPVFVEIATSGSTASPTPTPTPTPSPVPTPTPTPSPVPTPTPTPVPVPTPTPTLSATPDPSFVAPASVNSPAGQVTAINGVSISDGWAASTPGTLALNVGVSAGTLSMQDGAGHALAGSGTSGLQITGTLAQLNADLATLTYTGTGGADSLSLDTWDQAGVEASKAVTIAGASGAVTPPSGSGSTGGSGSTSGGTTIPADQSTTVVLDNNANLQASSGDHMIFLGGTGDTLTATGGTETVQAYNGGNTITTGAGNDTIRIGGLGNTVDAGGGSNYLADSGQNNTIVLPAAGQGQDDIYGWVMQNGDKFDLRPLLSQAGWNGDAASLPNLLSVTVQDGTATVGVSSGGSVSTVATLHASGQMGVADLLAHSVT